MLVILAGLLSYADGGTAAGYVALYLVGWSPLLWSIGYQLFSPERKEVLSLSQPSMQSFIQFIWFWIRRILNPPIYGTLIGLVIGATPISYFFYPSKGKFLDIHQSSEGFRVLHEGLVLFCQSIMEASSLLGSATVTVQTIILACAIGPLISDFGLRKGDPYETDKQSGEFNREKGYTIVLDKHIFWAIICIRLIGMPLAILFLVKGLLHMGLLPMNTILVFTILVLSAMPTAQNLVVMLQLNPSKAPLVETFANLLLYEYGLALASIPIWTTVFTAVFSRP
ncbi:protein PIN-LIKES 5 isoform X1 [Amborella trichopoda]|nr:protein PIN-LIKES 5 isoform X1 [Amborella trichopoda]XP_020519187.1 protein PIN-LIKES 5 isoform X1 [Amborella trichopoda]|eukprot:XP_006837154.2 protein PIN-LIKES 5 isoform X1 [Amborella trichopoda]